MKLIITQDNIEGYTAAWVAKRQLKGECELAFFKAGDRLPEASGKDIMIFGISFARHVVQRLAKEAASEHREFRLFDNDIRARAELAGIKEAKIVMYATPARLAWEHLRCDFKVKVGPSKSVDFRVNTAPWIVDYTEAEKGWKWPNLPRHFLKLAIDNCYKRELEEWDELATRDLAAVFEQGKEFAKTQQKKEEIADGKDSEAGEPSKVSRRKSSKQ